MMNFNESVVRFRLGENLNFKNPTFEDEPDFEFSYKGGTVRLLNIQRNEKGFRRFRRLCSYLEMLSIDGDRFKDIDLYLHACMGDAFDTRRGLVEARGGYEDSCVLTYNRRVLDFVPAVLFPLNKYYSARDVNIVESDERSFLSKEPTLIARYGLAGHRQKSNCTRLIASEFIDEWASPDDLLEYSRVKASVELRKHKECDVGFVLSEDQIGLVSRSGNERQVEMIKSYTKQRVSIEDMRAHKYFLALEGNDTATSLVWMLKSNSVVFSTSFNFLNVCHHGLEPYVHYIPVASDFSDVLSKIRWCERNTNRCLEIIRNANNLMNKMSSESMELAQSKMILDRLFVEADRFRAS